MIFSEWKNAKKSILQIGFEKLKRNEKLYFLCGTENGCVDLSWLEKHKECLP
jgi:hypothetical protein